MAALPDDLQKLPPQALDVLRFLGTVSDGASSETIMAGAGISERAFGKAIRRLVTRYYVAMPTPGYYTLTESGIAAANTLRDLDSEPSAPVGAAPVRATPVQTPQVVRHPRRVSVFLPKALIERTTSRLLVGFDRPGGGPALRQPARVIMRMHAPDCDIAPIERPIEVPLKSTAGPVDFRVRPHRTGTLRIRIDAFQLIADDALSPVGGMVFDLPVAGFPTPESAEFQTLAATLWLHPGEDD